MDYANTPYAARARWDKAHDLARWCWEQGLTPDQVLWTTDDTWAGLAKLAIGRPASETTRQVVHALMVVKAAWVAAFDPGATRIILTDEQVDTLAATATRRARK